MSNSVQSFRDLKLSGQSPMASAWNRLIDRLEGNRYVFGPGFRTERTPTYVMVNHSKQKNGGLQFLRSQWDGTVTFMRSRNILGPVAPSGTANVCIDIIYEGEGAGTVSYCDTTNWMNWPEHHIIMKVSQLPSGTFQVW